MFRLAATGLCVSVLAGCSGGQDPLRALAPQVDAIRAARLGDNAADQAPAKSDAHWMPDVASSHDNRSSQFLIPASYAQLAQSDVDTIDAPQPPPPGHRQRRPLPGFWETVERDLQNLPNDLWDDTKAVYGKAPNLIILGLTYGGSLAIQTTGPDDTIEDSLNHKTVFKEDVSDTFGALGNPAIHFGAAGVWYLIGQQRQDDKTYQVGRTLFSALTVNGLSTVAGKLASWDNSPNGEYFAFPSGHTSSTFTVASVMHQAYGPLAGVPLYGLGVLVAVERLDSGEHYFSDVVMGGVMGLVIGHGIASEHDLEIFGGRIVPFADPYQGATGVAWHFEF